MPTYIVDPNNAASPTDEQGATQGAEEIRELKTKINGVVAAAPAITNGDYAGPAGLVDFLHINSRYSHRDLIADGWYPAFFNQQWGGAPHYFEMVDSATGVPYKFEAFDGYIEITDASANVGQAASTFYTYQVFTAPKNLSLQAIWLSIWKVGNPVDNLTLQLWSVAAGVPNALIATANVINGKQITTDTAAGTTAVGRASRFSFAVVQALVAGTQYALVLSKSAGVDINNYYAFARKTTTKFPNNLMGHGTVAPVWTSSNTISLWFLAEAQTPDQSLTTGGTFNEGKYTFFEGNPLNRSNARCKELKDFKAFNPDDFTLALYGASWEKDKTILDITYGLDHDRIVLRSKAGTGLPELTIYEKDGTVETITGTTDISTAAEKLIGIRVRAKNDGADVLQIWINGLKEAETTLKSYEFDELFIQAQIGTFWLGGGWQLANAFTWTQKLDMTTLPSANGWTFTTTTGTVEGNVFAISNGKLNQIKSGMAAGGDGSYVKAAIGFNNVNGWGVTQKQRIVSSTNTKESFCNVTQVDDGTKKITLESHEYFLQSANAAINAYPQADLKSLDSVYLTTGKSSDYFFFKNGKLLIDGTTQMTSASALNSIQFGDSNTAAGENADALYDYLAYYNTANILPQCTSGNFSEFMLWSGDRTALFATLYNAGVFLSGKQVLGVKQNRLVEANVVQFQHLHGITVSPTTVSASDSLMNELEFFGIGSAIKSDQSSNLQHTVANTNTNIIAYIDGQQADKGTGYRGGTPQVGGQESVAAQIEKIINFGLHKIETRWNTGAATATAVDRQRSLTVNVRT